MICILLAGVTLLSVYYLDSLLKGAGASRLASTSVISVLFAGYELLGLSGIGPGRLELRDFGLVSLGPYWVLLIPACFIVSITFWKGVIEAIALRGKREVFVVGVLSILPLAIVISSGFVMHWRVLGRHLIAALPVLNIVFALGLMSLFNANERSRQWVRFSIGIAFLVVFIYSAASLRFADRHRKDDYRTAAAIAREEISRGSRVWWAADAIGANYYRLPGEFDFMGELTGVHKSVACNDFPGIQSISNASGECLATLLPPDMVILSKPESFDTSGGITAYLQSKHFAKVRELPAFAIWRATGEARATQK